MKWKAIKAVERGRTYTDHVSEDGRWRLARGYGESAQTAWTLLENGGAHGWRFRREVPGLDVAKRALANLAK
jgi:hypothetical protein